MKKITDLIINKRHAILIVFLILTGLSCYLTTKVEINSDLTKYLPSDSQTKKGTEIMNDEFSNVTIPGSLNIMFKGLTKSEKPKIYDNLLSIKGVSSIDYDDTENYNKDDYTLYIVNANSSSDSKTSKHIYEEILDTYEDYEIYTSGSIVSSNTDILPSWIMITSVVSAMIILIIMCDSYLEPFLFLISIIIAVILNAGTNIIFDSVSEVTNSISSILVMALSMDYSIMLINRFRSERENEKDDIKAMKNALYHSFKSISSSSLTTVVGLVTLVFMSFTIGRDLGLVLAKGVLLSLVSIFLVLPTLILTFDKWITLTEKKTINPKMKALSKLSYNLKTPITFVFVILFICSTLLKGNLSILYTSRENSKIDEIFGSNNQIAIVYNNNFESGISKYISDIENKEKVTSVQGYGNTLNLDLTYNNLPSKLTSLGGNVEIDEYLLKILYYHYYNKEENNTLTLPDFYDFITDEVSNNETLKDIIGDFSNDLNKLKYFVKPYEINNPRTVEELSSILDLNPSNMLDILVFYNSKNNNLELTLKEFVSFIKDDVITNEKYSKMFNEEMISKINTLDSYTNKEFITEEYSSELLSEILNIDEPSIKNLMLLKYSKIDNNKELTLEYFLNEILYIKENTSFLEELDIENLKTLIPFTNKNYINLPLDKQTLSIIFTKDLVDTIYTINNLKDTDTLTINDFINKVLELINTSQDLLDESLVEKIYLLKLVVDDTLSDPVKSYTSTEISELLQLDKDMVYSLYALIDYVNSDTDSWTMSQQELINLILNSEEIISTLDDETLRNLNLLQTVINLTLNDTLLNSENISSILGLEKSNIDLLYGLFVTKYINDKMSINTTINFILSNVITNEEMADSFTPKNITDLNNIKNIMDGSLYRRSYTKENMYNTLSVLTNSVTKNDIDLLYIYYGSVNNYDENWTITIEKFINYLNDDIIKDERFNNFLHEDMKDKIVDSKEKVREAKSLLVGNNYSRIIINTKLDLESDKTYNFIKNINNDLKENIKEFYIVGDSSMAYEMSESFGSEFNFISILTMIFLMIVVGITFKSFIIPIILVLLIQTAVYLTMGILSVTVGSVYFIALLVVQSILLGATIDYAICYTAYYQEYRKSLNVKEAISSAYKSSIHTILTSSLILIIVTFILGIFATDITSKICITISEGTLCSTLLILLLLPGTLATFDKFIIKKN